MAEPHPSPIPRGPESGYQGQAKSRAKLDYNHAKWLVVTVSADGGLRVKA